MFKKLSTKLEKMFDQPASVALPAERTAATTTLSKKIDFQIVENNQQIENLSYIFSADCLQEKDMSLLFSHLSCFFEGGFLLERKQTNAVSILTQAFWYGKQISCKQLNCRTLQLPNTKAFKVLKTSTQTLVSHFGLHNDSDTSNCGLVSYLIPLNHRYSIVVTTVLAEPWAKIRIELLQQTLMKINFPL